MFVTYFTLKKLRTSVIFEGGVQFLCGILTWSYLLTGAPALFFLIGAPESAGASILP